MKGKIIRSDCEARALQVKGSSIEPCPTQSSGQLKRVNGVLVFSAPGALTNDDYVSQSREDRIDNVMGVDAARLR
jgi:hypothetical protein